MVVVVALRGKMGLLGGCGSASPGRHPQVREDAAGGQADPRGGVAPRILPVHCRIARSGSGGGGPRACSGGSGC